MSEADRCQPWGEEPEVDQKALVKGVKEFALRNYEKDGWDILVECWSDEEIIKYMEGAKTMSDALGNIRYTLELLDEQRRSVRNEIF